MILIPSDPRKLEPMQRYCLKSFDDDIVMVCERCDKFVVERTREPLYRVSRGNGKPLGVTQCRVTVLFRHAISF